MNRQIGLFCMMLWCNVAQADYSISFLFNPTYQTYASNSLFSVPEQFIEKPSITSEQTIELTGDIANRFAGISYLFSAQNSLSDTSATNQARVNEIFVSKGIDNWDFTIGRKIDSWGVGYGFRPLDVVQQYNQQTTSRESVIGKDRLSVEYYFDISSWTLMWINPNQTKEEDAQQPALFVSKFSTSEANYDLHLVSQYHRVNGVQLGAGGVNIVTDSLSLHGSLLYSQRYEKKIHQLAGQSDQLLSTEYPYVNRKYNNGLQLLLGLSWSGENKHNIIAEYWFDEFAYTRQQWKAHFKLTRQQQSLLGKTTLPDSLIHGNIAWMANVSRTQNLAQHNLMLQWRYDADYWKPTINVLFAPADKSNMTTLSVTRSYTAVNIESGFRIFSGANDSVYGGLIVSSIFYITCSSEI